MQYFEMSDDELVSQVASLCLDGRRGVARLIVHLIEVEDRRIDKKSACDSMWSFCTKRMRMSEGETSRRLNAVKLVRKLPTLLGRIERGEIHLSALKILGPYLDASNAEDLLEAAKWKTKMEVRELVAARFPRPDAPTIETPVAAETASLSFGPAGAKTISKIEPLSADGYLVQTMLSNEGYANLLRAKELMRHRLPNGDTATVLEVALKGLVEDLEKQVMAKTDHPKKNPRPPLPGHILAAVRREVFERDGTQCAYVDAQGRRCDARSFLELDHVIPRARGGKDEASNLRVACRGHNRFYAEEIFGKDFVAEQIHYRQHQAQRVMKEEALEQATRGLVNMGFAKNDVKRALDLVVKKHPKGMDVQQLLRDAIAALTWGRAAGALGFAFAAKVTTTSTLTLGFPGHREIQMNVWEERVTALA